MNTHHVTTFTFSFFEKKGEIDHIRIYLMNANDAASNCTQNDDARKRVKTYQD